MTIRVLVPISGCKDSQACMKLAVQHYPTEQVRGLFCDTQHHVIYGKNNTPTEFTVKGTKIWKLKAE